MKKIIYEKNDNRQSDVQFERQKLINQKKNYISYIERPEFNSRNDNKQIQIDYTRYMLGNKISLGRNFIDVNTTLKPTNRELNNKNVIGYNKDLPMNIYHNFSESTRNKNKRINYDVSKRNI